jgi:WD40 repeat protein
MLETMNHHREPVHSAAVNKDHVVATASWDGRCVLFNLNDWKVSGTVGDDDSMMGLYDVAFSKLQPHVLGCTSVDQKAYLWDHTRCERLAVLEKHQDEVNSLDFHPTQSVLATSSDDCTSIVWDITENTALRILDQHTRPVYGVKFMGEAEEFLLLTVCFDRQTRVFDMRDRRIVKTFETHKDDVIGIDYHPGRHLVATGSDDGHICLVDSRVWRTVREIDTRLLSPDLAGNAVKRVAFHPEGTSIAAGCSQGCALVLDLDHEDRWEALRGHTDCVFDVAWGNSDPAFLVTASHDRTWKYWCTGAM